MLDAKKYDNLLNFVNRVRRRYGFDPIDKIVPGTSLNDDRCPIANSLKRGIRNCRVSVDAQDIVFETSNIDAAFDTPYRVARIVKKVDSVGNPRDLDRRRPRRVQICRKTK